MIWPQKEWTPADAGSGAWEGIHSLGEGSLEVTLPHPAPRSHYVRNNLDPKCGIAVIDSRHVLLMSNEVGGLSVPLMQLVRHRTPTHTAQAKRTLTAHRRQPGPPAGVVPAARVRDTTHTTRMLDYEIISSMTMKIE